MDADCIFLGKIIYSSFLEVKAFTVKDTKRLVRLQRRNSPLIFPPFHMPQRNFKSALRVKEVFLVCKINISTEAE